MMKNLKQFSVKGGDTVTITDTGNLQAGDSSKGMAPPPPHIEEKETKLCEHKLLLLLIWLFIYFIMKYTMIEPCTILSPQVHVSYNLFHHQIATCTENVKFREVNEDLLPGTSSGK